MKLMIDVRSLGTKPSGIGFYAFNFIKALIPFPDVNIVLLSDVAESEQICQLQKMERVQIRLFGRQISKTVGVFRYFSFVQEAIFEEKPDVFWEVNNLIPVRLKNPSGKIIVTIHDVFPIYMPKCYGRVYPIYFRLAMHNTLHQVDAIIYDSEDTKRITERIFPRAKRIPDFLGRIVVENSEPMSISDDGYFCYVGNLEKRKGTDLLLEAYREYRIAGGTRELLIAGKFREPDIEKLYASVSALYPELKCLGYLSEKEKAETLAHCGCFVFPSRAEGFGIPVVEAALVGKPLILSNLHVFTELIGSEFNPFQLKVNPVGNLKDAMLDESHWMRVDKAWIKLRFSAENLGKRLYDFLSELE